VSRIAPLQVQEQPVISLSCIAAAVYECVPPSQHDLALNLSISLSRGKRNKIPAPRTVNLLVTMLSVWASSTTSKLLIISGSVAARNYSKGLAAELIQLLQNQNTAYHNVLQPTLWALYKHLSPIPEPIHLLRQLVSQLLVFVPEPNLGIGEIFSRHQSKGNTSSTSKLDIAALSIDDWVEVFELLALNCGRVFIVVDLEMICRGLSNIEPYLAVLRRLVGRSEALVKIVVLEFARAGEIGKVERKELCRDNELSGSGEEDGNEIFFDLKETSQGRKKRGKEKGLLKGFKVKGIKREK
jgi:hypothetical protein